MIDAMPPEPPYELEVVRQDDGCLISVVTGTSPTAARYRLMVEKSGAGGKAVHRLAGSLDPAKPRSVSQGRVVIGNCAGADWNATLTITTENGENTQPRISRELLIRVAIVPSESK